MVGRHIRVRAPLLGLLCGIGLMVAIGFVLRSATNRQTESNSWVAHTYEVLEQLQQMLAGVLQAESAVRAFGISHDETMLVGVDAALRRVETALSAVSTLTIDNPTQQARVPDLRDVVTRRMDMLRHLPEQLRRGQPVSLREGFALTAAIQDLVNAMIQTERTLLASRTAATAAQTTLLLWIGGAGIAMSVTFLLMAFVLLERENSQRRDTEAQLRVKHEQEQALVEDMTVMLQTGELLQACRSMQEAYDLVMQVAPGFFSDVAGVVGIVHPSRNVTEICAVWRGATGLGTVFAVEDCWALRRGQPHRAERGSGVFCKHTTDSEGDTLCLPLVAHGELLGMLSMASAKTLPAATQRRATMMAEQLSLALANLQLRETLRNQSIRDPLTGLFNRRYMEETLRREIKRAAREGTSLGVLMLDVDHFKTFNDTFGHAAGDYVLRELAGLLAMHTRGSDVASRLGGEEFVVLLPAADLQQTRAKADRLRQGVEGMSLRYFDKALGKVTVSIGVAAFPQHGSDDDLVRAADAALYRAKNAGRNQVVVAEL